MNSSLKIHMVDNYDFGKPHTKYTKLTICIHLQSKMRYKWSKTHVTLVHKEIFVIILELFFYSRSHITRINCDSVFLVVLWEWFLM